MKIGIVISTAEPETVWNAFRFGVLSLKSGYEVNIFVMNKGVEFEDIHDNKYDIKKQVDMFVENKGNILACGTCLKSRQKESSPVCPLSTMQDLLKIVEESDKLLTFG